ncbi:hypothetical protein M876_13265 [Elizabethkingia anophelis FMS-007]|nr:hypothetical protein M876_13265 [Elizabethkingia anophelis FMS-007]
MKKKQYKKDEENKKHKIRKIACRYFTQKRSNNYIIIYYFKVIKEYNKNKDKSDE